MPAAWHDARESVLLHAQRMWKAGLVTGSSGNLSVRIRGENDAVAITPTSVPYEEMTAGQIAIVDLESGTLIDAPVPPSVETPLHLALYRARNDAGAVVHTHSVYASTLSVLHKPLPPLLDEMMIHFGGTIEVAEYAFFGSEDLGRNAVQALGNRAAVLMANHGDLCVGRDVGEALRVATLVENCARVYVEAMRSGEVHVLSEAAIEKGRQAYLESRKRSV